MQADEMKILVVDDVAAMRKIIRSALRDGGYTDVVEAVSGTDAMGKLDGVDLVLTDIYMPGMGGFSFVKALREIPKYKNLTIIAVTAENRIAMIERMLRTGVNDYIVKPFAAVKLLAKVDDVRQRLALNIPEKVQEARRDAAEMAEKKAAEENGDQDDTPSAETGGNGDGTAAGGESTGESKPAG